MLVDAGNNDEVDFYMNQIDGFIDDSSEVGEEGVVDGKISIEEWFVLPQSMHRLYYISITLSYRHYD